MRPVGATMAAAVEIFFVNRKQRRASDKLQPARPGPRELFAAAVQRHRDGRLEDAAQLYRQVLVIDPRHADSLHRLGVIAHQQGQHALAADMLHQAIACHPDAAPYHAHLGLALDGLGRLEEAVESCRKAVRLDPGLPDQHYNLGVLLQRLGRHEDAVACYRKAVALAPDIVEAHSNLGHALSELGRPGEAQVSYRRVIDLAPDAADGHADLGRALKSLGQFEEASVCLQQALQIAPAQTEILTSLAQAQIALRDYRGALASALRALTSRETPQTRRLFVQCVKDIEIESEIAGLRSLLLRALTENWDRPDDLARVGADVVRQAISRNPELGEEDFTALAADKLLQALICHTPNQDLELEGLLTAARRRLLQNARQPSSIQADLAFVCAMARQCFINEYVFAQGAEESEQAGRLRDRLAAVLEQRGVIDPVLIGVVGSYFPLLSVPFAPRLLERSWPAEIDALLTQQIREPMEEDALCATIPRLTVIKDDVSCLVQGQYEENPYPRWVCAAPVGMRQSLVSFLRQTFPFVPVEDQRDGQGLEILVAGCGTGRNAIETAQRFDGAQALAIDLSRNSLGHAARKTRELGVSGIEYAQADILELDLSGRRFDLIEAVGVLHHLADPFSGWRVLTSLLKPQGVMMVGLYSREARRDLPDAMPSGPNGTAQDVRQARQILIGQSAPVTQRVDFFTTSTCRDLLFHVQEHRLTLAEIGDFLWAQNLRLLGFSLEDAVLAAYRKRFPDDPGAVNLDHWQVYEKDHPDTFSGMYQFWLQKSP